MKMSTKILFLGIILIWAVACTRSEQQPSLTNPNAHNVIVLGMIHDRHVDSTSYSLPFLKRVIQEINPDFIFTEIPPDRFEDAFTGFKEAGIISEPRVVRFPEYVDVIFPLTREMEFEIVPTAAWTQPMAEFRAAALNRLARDETRSEDWITYTAALDSMNEKLKDREDDPFYIHTDEYDATIKEGLTPYARLFANDLGSGDWDTINRAHYELIAQALDRIGGKNKTILITFGAAHKYWFLEQLRARDDITVVNPLPYLEAATTKKPELR